MKLSTSALVVVAAIIFLPQLASAHQPRLTTPSTTAIPIEQPEVSKAFYGHLVGAPQVFEIDTRESFDFYAQVLVPDVPSSRKDFRIKGEGVLLDEVIFDVDGADAKWELFFEQYGQDSYLQGPEFIGSAPAGKYRITVSNPDNEGAYILVVGQKEKFPLGEALKTMSVLPTIKQDYFGKSGWSSLESPYFYGPIIFLVLLIGIIAWLTRH